MSLFKGQGSTTLDNNKKNDIVISIYSEPSLLLFNLIPYEIVNPFPYCHIWA